MTTFFSRSIPNKVVDVGLLLSTDPNRALLAGVLPPQLRTLYPDVRITAFIRTTSWSAIDLVSGIDDVLVLPDGRLGAAMRMLQRHPMDVMIDLSSALSAALLARLSGARFVVGSSGPASLRGLLQDATVPRHREQTDIEAIRALTTPLGGSSDGLPQLDPTLLRDAIARGSTSSILFHPWGYNRAAPGWPQAHWVQLAKTLLEEGFSVVITGDAPDYARAKELAASIALPGVEVAAGKTTLRQTALLLARSACLIGAESDALHLANILGTPLVALLDGAAWSPLHDAVAILPGSPSPAEVAQICRAISRPHSKASSPAHA